MKHRRPLVIKSDRRDPQSQAHCLRPGTDNCTHAACPQHQPHMYAAGLASHASDVYGTGTFA